jgi:hypothetical protein
MAEKKVLTPTERMAALQKAESMLQEQKKIIQREIDSTVPVFQVHGDYCKRGRHIKHAIGYFSTFEKAVQKRDFVKKDGGTDINIIAVPKSEVDLGGRSHYDRKFTMDSSSLDDEGYISD